MFSAVAAHCASYRIGTLPILSPHLNRELAEKQAAETASWPDWQKYNNRFTPKGIMKENPGIVKPRKRKSKMSNAISSGLLPK